MCYSVYQIENIINGKIYIGMTGRSVETRFKEHCRPTNMFISKQIQKTGIDNFKVSTIATFDTEKQARDYEIYCILRENARNPFGYNISCDGELADFLYAKLSGRQLRLF